MGVASARAATQLTEQNISRPTPYQKEGAEPEAPAQPAGRGNLPTVRTSPLQGHGAQLQGQSGLSQQSPQGIARPGIPVGMPHRRSNDPTSAGQAGAKRGAPTSWTPAGGSGSGASHAASPTPHKIAPSIADLKFAFEAELAPQTAKDFPSTIEPFIERLIKWKGIFQKRVDSMPDVQRLELLWRIFADTHNDVEVFGQYLDIDDEPNLDNHVRIERFSADVQVVRRHAGASRRVKIFGSDGTVKSFVLETSVNAATQRSEERATQLCRLINHLLDGECQTRKRRLSMSVPVLVPTSQNTRLVGDDPSAVSLSEALEWYMERKGVTMDEPLLMFRSAFAEIFGPKKSQLPAGAQPSRESYRAARLDAFKKVCDSVVPDHCLSLWVEKSIPNANSLFMLKKQVAQGIGVSGILCYALAIGYRRPQHIMLSRSTGKITQSFIRANVSQGIIQFDESVYVPFRLTRNIHKLLGNFLVDGVMSLSMVVVIEAILRNKSLFSHYLYAVLRNELMPRAPGRGDRNVGIGTNDLDAVEENLEKSVRYVFRRLEGSTDAKAASGSTSTPMSAISRVEELLASAQNQQAQSQMEPSWHAWF